MRYNIILDKIKDISNPVGAEIGVNCGVTTNFLLKNNANLRLIGVDPYILLGYDACYPSDSGAKQHNYGAQQDMDKLYNETVKLLAPYGDRLTLLRKTSVEASKDIEDNSLDFVFIDGNHFYAFVKEDILVWSKKVKIGGYIIGHDYNENDVDHKNGVCAAVNEFFTKEELEFGADKCWWTKKTREL